MSFESFLRERLIKQNAQSETGDLTYHKSIQSDKVHLSCLLLSQKTRQLSFSATRKRYVS